MVRIDPSLYCVQETARLDWLTWHEPSKLTLRRPSDTGQIEGAQ